MNDRMRRLPAVLLACIACVTLAACEEELPSTRTLQLAACTSKDSVFEKKPFKDWKKTYHNGVNAVIEAHMKAMRSVSSVPFQCTAQDYRSVVPASQALKDMAKDLPAWKDRTDSLRESDMAVVLLEYLRVYECSMNEYLQKLPITKRSNSGTTAINTSGVPISDLTKWMIQDQKAVDEERKIAREALERSLSLVGGFDRLFPLSIDIECLKRASLDMRNVLGLTADASTCLPRIWDAKGSLRDKAE
jgi:hypothetical protein